MYRLLIVDDEPIITNSIYQFFLEQSDLELELFRAYSAPEAMEVAERTRLDVVITDISMPVMNGIELQERLYRKWPNCKFIYLTSHDNVQYAQQAIRNGAFVDFVLKNEEDAVLLEAVRKAVSDIERTSKNEALLALARRRMQAALPVLQQDYLNLLFEGKQESVAAMEEQFRRLELPFRVREPVLMFYGRIEDYGTKFSVTDRRLLHFSLENIVQEHIGRAATLTSVSCDAHSLVWLLQPSPDAKETPADRQWEQAMRYTYDMLEIVQNACKSLLGVALSIVISEAPFDWPQLSRRYSRLKYAMNRYVGISQELLMVDHPLENDWNVANDDMRSEIRTRVKQVGSLERLLETGQRGSFLSSFEEIVNVPDEFPHSYRIELLSALQASLFSCANRFPRLPETIRLEDYMLAPDSLVWTESLNRLKKLAISLLDWSADDQHKQVSALMDSVRAYVQEHLQDDLSLTSIAERVFHNPSYFSKLFKRTMGIGYNEYVTEQRLNKAAALLTTTNMKVNEIALQIGYESPSYFMRVFKRHYKLTPQEFRESKQSKLI